MNTETFRATQAAELAVVTRGGFVESRHIGSAVVLDRAGEVRETFGAPEQLVLPRSALKPLIALGILSVSPTLLPELTAIAMASHEGTPAHVLLVQQLLTLAGVTEDALQCPEALPGDRASRIACIREGVPARSVTMCCSGKHAAMLFASTANGWPVETYCDPDHPLQQHIRDTVQRFTGEKITVTVPDGCGAPVHAVSLGGLARAIRRLATAAETSPFPLHRNAALLTRAARTHGWIIAGPGHPDTLVIERLGVFAKFGAEGIMVMAAQDGTTVAVKMLDGSPRASTIVALELLVRAGSIQRDAVDQLRPELGLAVLGGRTHVGDVTVTL